MKYFFQLILYCGLWIISNPSWAIDKDKTLRFEVTPYKNSQVYCDNNKRIKPTKNDFELLDYTAMSSDQGDRIVLVTLKNVSNGQRLFNQSHIIAVLGDCSRTAPANIEKKFSGSEILTIRLNFGLNRYPILKLLN